MYFAEIFVNLINKQMFHSVETCELYKISMNQT